MNMNDEKDAVSYVVVKNEEEQYAILPEHQSVPAGWKVAGPKGEKRHCLDYIQDNWTDMRPLSVRAQGAQRSGSAHPRQ
ncbi:MbtH protein [Duganella sp. 1411]|uniref:MbtH family protein n=1 Tax=Duganella sp. 1411 TaxID=2806572 RepID=UPI001AE2C8AF|nr:MbtH family NRPS accessory protein [Duganella sp. 1411]MBP1207092.1 MbtH protein [Duganella sp. 1411]